jgi:uncharacterized membrane protein YeaQ/YmgE (transglycosylase-associated protein family)
MEIVIVLVCLVVGLIFGGLGSWIANQKRRDGGEGFVLGFLFGPFGCLIEALLPNKLATDQSPQAATKTPEQLEEVAEAARRAKEEYLKRQRAEVERLRIAEEADLAELERRRAMIRAAFARCWGWFRREIIGFGWYRKLPDVAQPIVLGLGISLPAVVVVVWLINRGAAQ